MEKVLNCVLLIDNDEPTNFLHKMIIERHGCAEKIEVCESAIKALEFLKLKVNDCYANPDLIFLDINMPVMDGWDFMEEYEKLPEDQKGNIVIVMLTTSLNPSDEKKAKQFEEIAGFKNKPMSYKMLDDILQEYFPERLKTISSAQ
jgi:CheY-like chemotaxis protein